MNVQSISLLVAFTAAVTISTSANADPSGTGSDHQLDREINAVLNLDSSWHTTLQIDEAPNQPIRVSIPLEDGWYTLELEPHSVRDEAYSLFMQDAEGEIYEVEPGPIRTLRGPIAELEGSLVAGSLMEDGLYARIRLADGSEYWMEPVGNKIDRAPSNMYAFYRNEDIIPSGGSCASEHHMDVSKVLHMLENYDVANSANRGDILKIAQIACDADYEYFQDWGSNTESRINSVINGLNSQYESEVLIRHEITSIIVRSDSNDPYTSSDAGALLDQFRNHWNSNHGSIARDVAHLFTGRNLDGGTIGVAWLGVVCYTSSAYGLVQSDCCGSLGCATDLSAHELGHNWSASHQDSTPNTMYSSLTCSNFFIAATETQIGNYVNSVNCLENGGTQGACCIVNGQCVQAYESICSTNGGTYQGDFTDCASVSCADPIGACCINGSCSDYSEYDCNNADGDYAGDDTDCLTTGCSLGACCLGIDCSLTLLSDCSGSWFGDGSTCADTSCGAGTDQLNYELRTWSDDSGQLMETYDLYFPSSDANTRMVSVFGQDADLLQLRGWSNADFDNSATLVAVHQSSYGNDGPHDRTFDPIIGDELVYDSYVTIGSTDLVGSNVTLIGFDSIGFNSAAGIEMDNGVWFVTPDDPMASEGAGTTLGHRLASISVESGQGLEILTNVQWFDGASIVHETRSIYWNNLGLGGGPDCPTDLNGSGSTDVSDLLMVIGAWGPCSGCVEDINGSGYVDVSDLLAIIAAWGACE